MTAAPRPHDPRPHDPRPDYERAADQMESLIAAVTPDRLSDATPCAGWDVRTLVAHVVDGTDRMARVGEGGDGTAMPAESAWADVPDDGWPATYAAARARLRAAWAPDVALEGTYTVPWGQVPGRGVLAGEFMETLVHGWDLSRALGGGHRLDEDLAAGALAFAEQAVPAEPRGGPVPFGPPRPAPEGADATTRLAAWLGRQVGDCGTDAVS